MEIGLSQLGQILLSDLNETRPEESEEAIDPDIMVQEEEEIISTKTPFEQEFIRKLHDVFRERYVLSEPMRIKLREFRDSWQSNLYSP